MASARREPETWVGIEEGISGSVSGANQWLNPREKISNVEQPTVVVRDERSFTSALYLADQAKLSVH